MFNIQKVNTLSNITLIYMQKLLLIPPKEISWGRILLLRFRKSFPKLLVFSQGRNFDENKDKKLFPIFLIY